MNDDRNSKSSLSIKAVLAASVGFSALVAGGNGVAIAQEEADDESRTLQTITVTATKREQTLQDVPVAVSVVDETVIDKAEIIDLGDLQSVVPSLSVGQLQSSANTNFIIRGFGNGANNAGIEPSVGVFIDGVYRSRSAAQIADLPNLQRVEVLRGPQSTLFGKNASAGVISIVTAEPQREWGGNLEGSIGNYSAFRLKGDVTGPIGETLAFSLAANLNERDGYAEDFVTGSDVNQRDRYGFRGQLLFEPTDTLKFRLIGDFDKIDEICCVAGNVINGPTGAVIGLLGGQIDAEDPFSYEVFNNFDSTNDIENQGVSLQGDLDLGFATATSITSYRTVDALTNQDSDFTSADLVSRNFNETNIETVTQEIRLTSNPSDSRFDWMIGGFYFDETVDLENEFFYGDDFRGYVDALTAGGVTAVEQAILGLPAGTFSAAGQGPSETFGQENQAWSIFGTVDFRLTDRLTATVGLNYTNDEKDAFGQATNTDAFSALDLVTIGGGVISQTALATTLATDFGVDVSDPANIAAFAAGNPAVFAQVQAGADAFAAANATDPAVNPLLALQPVQFLPPFLAFPNSVEDGQSNDENTTYTFRLAYDATDNINVYGSVATGFKATSWNLSRDSRPVAGDLAAIQAAGLSTPNLTTGTRFAGPEEATVYELGIKGAFDRVAFNAAIFDQTIEGFQSNVFTGTGFELLNAGEQSTQGVELDVTWNPVDPLTLVFAGTFLDPVYDSFPDSASGDLSGQTPAGIPEVSTSISATYDFLLNNGWDAFLRSDWQYASETPYFDDAANQALIGFEQEINTFNASAGFTTDGGLSVTAWARNIFDDEYITTAFPSVAQAGSLSGYPSQPATYGVTVRQRF